MGLSSVFKSKAAQKARQQAEMAREQQRQDAVNDQNRILEYYRQSRGEGGFAQLPFYATTEGGAPFEPLLFADARQIFDSTAIPGDELVAMYKEAIAPFQESANLAFQQAGGLFDGRVARAALENTAPARAARTQAAEAQAQAGEEGLAESLNRIMQGARRKGYSGDSAGTNLLNFEATRRNKQANAAARGAANIANAEEQGAIKNQVLEAGLNNSNLPLQLAQSNLALSQEPTMAALRNNAARQSLFDSFRLPVQQPGFQPSAPYYALPSKGQIMWQGAAELAQQTEEVAAKVLEAYLGSMGGAPGGGSPGGGGIPINFGG